MDIEDITFDDILKNGPEWGNDLLRSAIGRELDDHDRRVKALTTIRINERKNTSIRDLLTYLDYNNQRRKK